MAHFANVRAEKMYSLVNSPLPTTLLAKILKKMKQDILDVLQKGRTIFTFL